MYSTAEFALISFSLIFFIVDPLGNIPVFLALTEGISAQERKKIAWRACLASFCLLLAFAFIGELMLRLFLVTMGSFRIAG